MHSRVDGTGVQSTGVVVSRVERTVRDEGTRLKGMVRRYCYRVRAFLL